MYIVVYIHICVYTQSLYMLCINNIYTVFYITVYITEHITEHIHQKRY